MPFMTWLTSAPAASQTLAMALMNEILAARKALEAYLMTSAEGRSVMIIGRSSGRVQLDQRHGHLLGGRADHDAVRAQRVLDGRALAQELGVATPRRTRWAGAGARVMTSRTSSPVPTGTVDLLTTTL